MYREERGGMCIEVGGVEYMKNGRGSWDGDICGVGCLFPLPWDTDMRISHKF